MLTPNTSTATPIYKKGDKSIFANYRPLYILPAFSKIFEKLAYNRIINFLDKHDILSDNQYGFRKGDQQIQLSMILWRNFMKM